MMVEVVEVGQKKSSSSLSLHAGAPSPSADERYQGGVEGDCRRLHEP